MCYEQDIEFMVCDMGHLDVCCIDSSISQESAALMNSSLLRQWQ